mmetsp:Transcript_22257/g.53919  ORF Transcript_22257/g.53919 Transcript_22257/m.53919 type:complete len:305 (-) Transcript_22257:226-1140(-)
MEKSIGKETTHLRLIETSGDNVEKLNDGRDGPSSTQDANPRSAANRCRGREDSDGSVIDEVVMMRNVRGRNEDDSADGINVHDNNGRPEVDNLLEQAMIIDTICNTKKKLTDKIMSEGHSRKRQSMFHIVLYFALLVSLLLILGNGAYYWRHRVVGRLPELDGYDDNAHEFDRDGYEEKIQVMSYCARSGRCTEEIPTPRIITPTSPTTEPTIHLHRAREHRRPHGLPSRLPGSSGRDKPNKKTNKKPGKKQNKKPGKGPGKKPNKKPGKKPKKKPGKKPSKRPGKNRNVNMIAVDVLSLEEEP